MRHSGKWPLWGGEFNIEDLRMLLSAVAAFGHYGEVGSLYLFYDLLSITDPAGGGP